ncbi:hydrolase, alpha/beta domain protein [Aeromicrobium marinum DSM 15272]|uniref:Hydrolase, alpha/beta domain protein n=1 Tax=Aeromicrobium marinum DSM 15272 TaxID=585531 RepID=E2SCH4_9ACTN|nr:alpha/beta hydrolase [Aeromicrobium marinum]EFQ82927.1 hydrolase, alpha/beta domain protein [Aeromicrobium marinum DSM 15272]
MTSWQLQAVNVFLRLTKKRRYATAARGVHALHHGRDHADPPRGLAGRITGRPLATGELLTVAGASRVDGQDTGDALVYLHGGAFVHGMAPQHWMLVAHLAEHTGLDVHVVRYGLAPTHGIDDAHTLLAELATTLRDRRLHVLGDSAGGNLALLLAQFHGEHLTIAGMTLLAPWLDVSLANPEVDAVEPTDPWLSRAGMHPIAERWAGPHARDSARVSPLFGDLSDLPPTLVMVGSRDVCLPDALLLRDRATPAGRVSLTVADGAPHVYPLLPVPEGRTGRTEIVTHVRRTFDAE